MGLPNKLKNFATFIDGVSYVGETDEVSLPKLSRKMEKFRAGGMSGEVEMDFGMEAMEMEIKAAGWLKDTLKTWGSGRHDAVLVRWAGACQTDDSEAVDAVEVVVRGRFKEFDPGKAKGGDKTEHGLKLAVSYYKLTINADVLLEIDVVNMIEFVHGVDRLQEVRAALGI
ncbi:phage major tail tube protein [Verminephrobacter aporrectodeae subsp. tuberculatae]|uniref:Phage major tail tube protein n=1 Tax=Verminephrobacter aporrectodeae subsp. tuberculatae TaxID=1110392 RepID=A0ABT3KQF2_9BURK|nr:phage major tail tube protein [Verminephrobacter aporrectodeae]MCW5320556.1 phage major tail tube protein [Verminephrobacter aporrectodeae subsp. tuberculatae]